MSKPNLMEDTWEVVQHNWHETSINCVENKKRICKLDTEDWDVDEDNQEQLESVQLEIATLITAAPKMYALLGKLQKNILAGNCQIDKEMENLINEVMSKNNKA